MASKSDYYETLGVAKTASADDIKKAYRKQAVEWHPDKHQGGDKEKAEKKFKEINEAYQVLSDPQKKQMYDQVGHSAFENGGGGAGYGGFGGQSPFGGSWKVYTSGSGESPFGNFDFGDPFDIFEQFFGGGSPFGGRQTRRIPQYSIEIDFMDAIRGIEKEVSVEGKKRKIKIPPGVDTGARIQFADFVLVIQVKSDKIFERQGSDIYAIVKIPLTTAILGGTLKVPTVDGDTTVRIRPGTQFGTMLRLRGKGVPHLRSKSRGDEYIRLQVEMPEKLNREQKKLIEELKSSGI